MMTAAAEIFAGLFGVGALAAIAFAASPDPMVPINEITPGVVASTDPDEVCGWIGGHSYSQRHRDLRHDKYRFLLRYGYDVRQTSRYELDHRVPLSLGGADVAENLWPEPWTGQFNAHDKDLLEKWAYRAVCIERTLPLREAQAIFLGDWREAFYRVSEGGRMK
jgi:hypothetical protein